MSHKQNVERDISLTFDFLRYAIDHPEMIDDIPEGSEIEFVGPDVVITQSETEPDTKKKKPIITTKRIFELPSSSQASLES